MTNWRIVLGRIQYEGRLFLPAAVEAYLLLAVHRVVNNLPENYCDVDGLSVSPEKLTEFEELSRTADNSLLLAVIAETKSPTEKQSLHRLINCSINAYARLAQLNPSSSIYQYIYENYSQVYSLLRATTDVIREGQVGEISVELKVDTELLTNDAGQSMPVPFQFQQNKSPVIH